MAETKVSVSSEDTKEEVKEEPKVEVKVSKKESTGISQRLKMCYNHNI